MLQAPDLNPIAVSLGPLQVHWYGLMYLFGFASGWALGTYRAKQPASAWTTAEISDLAFFAMVGVVIGGRLGYVLFYQTAHYAAHPLDILRIWTGGMSFHGGLLGVLVTMWFYALRTERPFLAVTDFLAPLVPLGLAFGRLGNFINQELWGIVTDVPWGMVFERTGGSLPRHPSQLYELALEGILLFVIIWSYSSRPRNTGATSALFLICYGLFRFLVEFVRVPDAQLGYLAFGWVTMGQMLSLPIILFGGWLLYRSHAIATK